jgi:hypothetical protein
MEPPRIGRSGLLNPPSSQMVALEGGLTTLKDKINFFKFFLFDPQRWQSITKGNGVALATPN